MKNKEKNNWCVYLLHCTDNSYYCGITNNLEKRIETHNAKKGAKYTRGRTPVKLLISKGSLSKSDAMKLEKKVKSVRKDKKVQLLEAEI